MKHRLFADRKRVAVALVLCLTLIALIPIARLGFGWKRAIDDVDAMIVTPVTLPATAQPTVRPSDAYDSSQAVPLDGTPQPTDADPAPTAAPGELDPVNILLLGTDARVGEDITRTDAMILVHINPATNDVSVLSFPRDLWVSIPGMGKARINAAYPMGEKQLGAGYGAALAKETVSELVGVPIHHFVLINFEGFRTIIDQIGGIDIDVPRAIDDRAYPRDAFKGDTATIKIHFDAGMQHMDGEQALIYARTRHADNDFGRNQRQQQMLTAVFEKVRKLGLLSQVAQIDSYTGALRDYIRTDISAGEMVRLGKVGSGLKPDDVQRFAIDSKMIVNLQGPATFAADPEAMRQIVEQMMAGEASPPR